MNFYVPIGNESKHDSAKPIYTPRIMGRFALTSTAYKYMDIGISVGPMSFVEMHLGDNRGNRIVLPHTTWTTLIEKRADIQRLVKSTASSSLHIRDLVLELVSIRNEIIVKLTLLDRCLYMKPSTVLFLLDLEHCVDHAYFWLCQNTHRVSERFKYFVNILRSNCITDRCDAAQILHKVADKTSPVDCELLAYAFDKIIYDVSE